MLSLRAKILLFYILLQKYNNISKQARKSGKSLEKVTGKGRMFISARKYKKDETVSDYSDSFVSSRHRIKRKELWRKYQMTWDGSLTEIPLYNVK